VKIDAKTLASLAKAGPAELERIRIQAQAAILDQQRRGVWTGGVVAHSAYAQKPVEWIVEHLGIAENTIRWSLNPEYAECYCPRCEEHGNAGKPHLWDGDVDPLAKALECVSRGESVAVSSATSTGKTFVIGACGTLYFLATHERSVVFNIAPKQDLLLKNMWKEIGRMWPRFKAHFPKAQILSGNLRMLEGEGESEIWAATAFGAGVGADEELAQRLKGFHQPFMWWIVEEMPGVNQAMVETIVKTSTADMNPILGMGNPEHQHDPLAAFGKRDWVTAIRISALDFPNVVANREIVPGARSRWSVIRDLSDVDGLEDHPHYLAQVRGIAPAQSRRALIRWEWCERAAERHSDPDLRDGPLALGIDPADKPTGDKSAISRWQGACCTEVVSFSADDASEVGRIVYQEVMDEENPIDPRHVGIDAVGVGASTVNELKRLGIKVRYISGGMRAAPGIDVEGQWSETEEDFEGRTRPSGPVVVESERYANERSRVFWRLREDLRLNRIALPNDPRLFEELTSIEYEEPNGKITVEKKESIRAKLRRSPDKADAVAYGNAVRSRRPTLPRRSDSRLPDRRRDGNTEHGLEMLLTKHAKHQMKERKRMERALKRRAKSRGRRG